MGQTLTVEDQLSVRQLLARYPRFLDNRDVEGYLDAFAPEGVIEMETGVTDGVSQFREVRGQTEIRAMLEGLFNRGPDTPSQLRHVVGEPVIEPSDHDGCEAHSYCVIFRLGADGPSVASIGEYTDECVKLDGRWVFARRRMVFRPFLG